MAVLRSLHKWLNVDQLFAWQQEEDTLSGADPERVSDLHGAACCLSTAYWLPCPVMRKHGQVPDSMHCSLHLIRLLLLTALVVLQLHKEAEAEKKKVSCSPCPRIMAHPCAGALAACLVCGALFW